MTPIYKSLMEAHDYLRYIQAMDIDIAQNYRSIALDLIRMLDRIITDTRRFEAMKKALILISTAGNPDIQELLQSKADEALQKVEGMK